MKRPNKFENLPAEDQQFILKTCDENPYHIALQILARPRSEGGLAFYTSRTALCRFYTHHHPDHRVIEQLGQYADAVRIQGQAYGQAALEALVILVQNRLLQSLKNGKALADLDREFRTLERVQRCFLAKDKSMRGRSLAFVHKPYHDHAAELASAPESDFMRNDIEKDPGAADFTPEHAKQGTPDTRLERDILAARTKQNPPPNQIADPMLALMRSLGLSKMPRKRVEKSASISSSSPDFPHFPPNSVSTAQPPTP